MSGSEGSREQGSKEARKQGSKGTKGRGGQKVFSVRASYPSAAPVFRRAVQVPITLPDWIVAAGFRAYADPEFSRSGRVVASPRDSRMSRQTVAVTGGTGFLGSCVVRALREAGYRVCSCSRREGVDLRDASEASRWLADAMPDVVVHCAAHVGGLGYVATHAVEVFHDNLEIAGGLLRGMAERGLRRLVTVMPNCTYPGDKEVYLEDEWWDGAIHPSVLMYGLPRKALWGLCKTYGDSLGLLSGHLILPNLYGPGDHFDEQRSHALGAIISKVMAARHSGQPVVEIWGTGRPVREWMYVEDASGAVAAFLRVIEQHPRVLSSHPLFNVGVGRGVSIAELADRIRATAHWDGSLSYDGSRPDGARQKLLDGTRFARLTGFHPKVGLQEGIERTVRWFEREMEAEPIHEDSRV